MRAGDRLKWHRSSKTIDIGGAKYYIYKYYNAAGNVSKRKITNRNLGKKSNRLQKTSSFFRNTFNVNGSTKEDLLNNKSGRNHVFNNSNVDPSIRNMYNDFAGKHPVDFTPEQRKNIKDWRNNDPDKFKDFLRYGMGVKDEKIDFYTSNELSQFGEVGQWLSEGISDPSRGDGERLTDQQKKEQLEEWAQDEDIRSWVSDTESSEVEGRDVLKEEEQIVTGQSSERYKQIEQLRNDNLITQEEFDVLVGQDGILQDIEEKEKSSREAYRGEYEEAEEGIRGLQEDLSESIESRGLDKDIALDAIIDEYTKKSKEDRGQLTEGIEGLFEAEKELEARTGLERGDTSIAELVKEYMPTLETNIEDYIQKTGKTQEEAIKDIRDYKTVAESGISDFQESLGSSWEDIERSFAGGEGYGQTMLDALTGAYGQSFQTKLEELIGTEDHLTDWSQQEFGKDTGWTADSKSLDWSDFLQHEFGLGG